MHAILKPMKRFVLTVFCILTAALTHSQIHEIGLFAGGSNFIGDVGATNYIKPNELAFGAVYKWNKSPRHSWRASYMQSSITANDADSDSPGRQLRGYSFENSIKELSAGLEFNFFEFNLHELKRQFTPYVYGGVSYFRYDSQYVLNNETREDESNNTFAIPMILGIKTNITPQWVLSLEVGVRYTFADDIDGSNPKKDSYKPLKFGNINSNDWYTFSGITLSYTFGENPCYCPN